MLSFAVYCEPEQGIMSIDMDNKITFTDYSNYEPIDNIEDLARGLEEYVKDF